MIDGGDESACQKRIEIDITTVAIHAGCGFEVW